MVDDVDVLDQGYRAARKVLSGFLDPRLRSHHARMIAALRPRPEDFAHVFSRKMAPRAEEGYQALWAEPIDWELRPEQSELLLAGAFSDDFKTQGPLSRLFPGGYRAVAGHLAPRMMWFRAEFREPGKRFGTAIDGFVPIDGRWAWFPKPWRVIPRSKRRIEWSY
jgi:hypothetical protein